MHTPTQIFWIFCFRGLGSKLDMPALRLLVSQLSSCDTWGNSTNLVFLTLWNTLPKKETPWDWPPPAVKNLPKICDTYATAKNVVSLRKFANGRCAQFAWCLTPSPHKHCWACTIVQIDHCNGWFMQLRAPTEILFVLNYKAWKTGFETREEWDQRRPAYGGAVLEVRRSNKGCQGIALYGSLNTKVFKSSDTSIPSQCILTTILGLQTQV